MYNTKLDITFKTTMLKFSIYDYNHAYIFAKGRIAVRGAGDDADTRQAD